MSKSNTRERPARDGWLMVLYGLLLLVGLALLTFGVIRAITENDLTLMAVGVLAVIVPAALYPIASAMAAVGPQDVSRRALDPILAQLRLVNERLLLSDTAKQIAFRTKDRQALREAIKADMDSANFDAALVLAEQMVKVYGDKTEAKQLRSQIQTSRARQLDNDVNEATAKLDEMLLRHEWDTARREAQKIQRQYADSPRVTNLAARIEEACHQHKHNLERKFLEAAGRDDVERAFELLRELDMYLTEAEAAPLRETARGGLTQKRTNLGVQFKLAVHDKDWIAALRIGQEIMDSFPNTKMAAEVRGMQELLEVRTS